MFLSQDGMFVPNLGAMEVVTGALVKMLDGRMDVNSNPGVLYKREDGVMDINPPTRISRFELNPNTRHPLTLTLNPCILSLLISTKHRLEGPFWSASII